MRDEGEALRQDPFVAADPMARAMVLEAVGWSDRALGDLDRAATLAEAMLEAAEILSSPHLTARAHRVLSAVAAARQDVEALQALLEVSTGGGTQAGYPAVGRVVRHLVEEQLEELTHLREVELAAANDALRRSNRALEAARDEARRIAEARRSFLGRMSHEIRTPLHGVVGTLDLLAATGLGPRQRAMVDTMERSAGLTLAVVDDILDLGKIESGEVSFSEEPIDLHDTLEGVAAAARPQASTGVRVVVDPGTPRWVLGDGQRVEQVVLNLVSNAVKYAREAPVRVRASVVGEALRIAVSDDGPGISSDEQQLLFDPYVQRAGTRSGTGLGLAIARGLVGGMRGQIGVTSRVGEGSTFWFTLPLRRTDAPVSEPTPERQDLGGLDIVLAEDNPVNAMVLQRQLELLGARVRAVADGAQAIRVIREDPPDLALIDLHMPARDGREVVRTLRAEGLTLPMLALTASVLDDDRESCLTAGMDEVLTKPVRKDALADTLLAVLHGTRSDSDER